MTTLRAGELGLEGFTVVRSGVRWLRHEGQLCNPGDPLAYCNLGLAARPGTETLPFAGEHRDLQVAFLSPASGRLRKGDVSQGGFMDRHEHHNRWKADFSIGNLELRAGEKLLRESDGLMPLLFLTGRRVTQIADVRTGLLSGWYDRARMWRADAGAPFTTLLSLGICEQAGIFRGEQDAFFELAGSLPPSTHVVWYSDDSLVPSARVLLEQLQRTPEKVRELEADAAAALARVQPALTGSDWVVAGAMLSALSRSPLEESYDLATRSGLVSTGPADIVVLSLNAESAFAFVHKRLGYTLTIHGFRIGELGPGLTSWLKADFDIVSRPVAEIAKDYYDLIDALRARRAVHVIMLNAFSTTMSELIVNYAPFEQPMSDVVSTVRAKELNVLLHDLARDRGVVVVDNDALVAMLGAARHLTDGVHQSGLVQALLREQIVRIVNERLAV